MLKLYYSRNLNPRVAVAVARHLQSPVEFVRARPFHPEQRPAFLKMNPNGRVPLLEENGQFIWETDAIACRLSQIAGTDFWRTGAEEPAMIQWISWAAQHFTHAAAPLYFERVVVPQFPPQARPPPAAAERIAECLEEFREFAAVLDAHLGTRTWVLGERMSYADFRVATSLPFAERAGLPAMEFPNVMRWHGALMQLDAWRDPFAGLMT